MSVRFTITDSSGEVVDALRATIDGLSDFRPMFDALRPEWYASRRMMFDTLGADSDTPWPRYEETPEDRRYVYVKAAILGDRGGRTPSTDILQWGGPNRLRRAVQGESSEGTWVSESSAATVTVDVPYASNHDEGRGTAPEWAWPRGVPYTTPHRRIMSPAGSFAGSFADVVSGFVGESGGAIGLKSAQVIAEVRATYQAGL